MDSFFVCIYYRASLIAQLVKNLPAVQETWVLFLGWEDPLEKEMATTLALLPGEFHGQRSLVGREAWWAIVHGVAKSWTQLND